MNERANVNVHIERLVIEGIELPPAARAPFQAAFSRELTRLVSTCGVRAELATSPSAAAPGVHVARGMPPSRLGEHVARAVYAAIGNAPCD